MLAQHVGDLEQRAVAGLVAVLVVELLEAVEIEHEQRERPAGARLARGLAGERELERAAVGEARERVGEGRVRSSAISRSERSLRIRTTIAAPMTSPPSETKRLMPASPGWISTSVTAYAARITATCRASTRRVK